MITLNPKHELGKRKNVSRMWRSRRYLQKNLLKKTLFAFFPHAIFSATWMRNRRNKDHLISRLSTSRAFSIKLLPFICSLLLSLQQRGVSFFFFSVILFGIKNPGIILYQKKNTSCFLSPSLFLEKKNMAFSLLVGEGNLIFRDGVGLKAAGETRSDRWHVLMILLTHNGTFLIILLLNERGRFPTTPQLLFPQTFLI